MNTPIADLPLNGAISAYYQNSAPKDIHALIADAHSKDILSPTYPYKKRMARKEYETTLAALQIELVKMQSWVHHSGARVAVVFEGRDAAGKGGTIKRVRENLNPRIARTIALAKPSSAEAGQWYFQRYIQHLPTAGTLSLFDRSWYNRGVVEHVFGFCSPGQREVFFNQVQPFERMLVEEGITLIKIWLTVSRAEQLRRFLQREGDPLKHWKLSRIDAEGLSQWDAYTDAIEETLSRSHTDAAQWRVIRSDDKRRARIAAIRTILHAMPYDGKDNTVVVTPDPKICQGPELLGISG